jgi:Flp pilus assembly protein TadB
MPIDLVALTSSPAMLPTVLGVVGFLIYAGADIALCLRTLSSEGVAFYVLSATAACLIGISLLYTFNLGAFLTEVFCLVTSLLAIILRLRAKARRRATDLLPPRLLGMTGARPMPTRNHRAGGGLFPDRVV